MTRRTTKSRTVEKPKLDPEFLRVVERNLRRDRKLLEMLAKI